MPPDISKILTDLYALDPALKKHEADLTKLIQELLLSRPDTKFDEAFARRLHSQLLTEQPLRSSVMRSYTVSMKKMMYTLFGSAAVVAAALLITIFSGKVAVPANRLLSLSSPKQAEQSSTHTLAANAFGSLVGGLTADEKGTNITAPALPLQNQTSDAALAPAPLLPPEMGMTKTVSGLANTAMIMRPNYPYAFVYKGNDIALPDKNVDVFRRIKPSSGRADLAQALTGVAVGGVNLGSFSGSSLMSFELRQPTSDGYTISVQVGEGTVGINRTSAFNLPPVPLMDADKTPIENMVPSDTDIATIAAAFLHNHAIDLTSYGEPVVEKDWPNVIPLDTVSARPQAAPAESKAVTFMPQSATVLFPRKLNGHYVYNQGGSPDGITVQVNVQGKAVESVWGIQTTDYESSAYGAATDVQKILNVVERGGLYGDGHPTDAQVPVIELGTPERVYMVYYKYENNMNEELLVPALRFPITHVPDGIYYYQKSIVVPLVAELLEQNNNPGPIMYMKGAGGVSGGATLVSPPSAPQLVPAPTK